jgi:Ca-activated chloride channel homolog
MKRDDFDPTNLDDVNNPKWTAYALGEITDERERAEMEQRLERSTGLREIVEEIRQTAGLLIEEFEAEPAVRLTPAQKERIAVKAAGGHSWFGLRPAWVVAAAAVLMLSVVTLRNVFLPEIDPLPVQTAERRVDIPPWSLPQESARTTESEAPAVADSRVQAGRSVKETPTADEPSAIAAEAAAPIAAAAPVVAAAGEAAVESPVDRALLKIEIPDAGKPETSVTSSPLVGGNMRDLITVMDGAAMSQAPAAVRRSPVVGGLLPAQRLPPTADVRYGRPWELDRMPFSPKPGQPFNTEDYDFLNENAFLDVRQNPLSTFSIDVDTASYSIVRRFLNQGQMPPKDAVRIEELINYFDYDYAGPKDDHPFAANFELTEAPWNPQHRLLRIGLKGREIAKGKRPPLNLVFLIDVSGSMAPANRLPMVKQALGLLIDRLTEYDRVSIVVYAGDSGLQLPSTHGDQKERIRHAVNRLYAGGGTHGSAGIQLAYTTAEENFIEGGVNRVILATDGDFNIGVTNRGDLTRLIEEKAQSGIFLTALGFGMGNYKDTTLELLANKGRGNYAYIDTIEEARKVLVDQIDATLVAIAQDVKIQVEFNPRHVESYRLIGYENRLMAKEDFNDDTKMAGVIGAGHAVTALYELVPAGAAGAEDKPQRHVDALRYQRTPQVSMYADTDELVTVKIRSKLPEEEVSVLSAFTIGTSIGKFPDASRDFRFVAAVAGFGMVLRDSPHKGDADLDKVLEWAKEGKGEDVNGYRREFIRLVHRAISLSK